MALVPSTIRNEQRSSLLDAALTIPARTDVRITSWMGLRTFITMGQSNANIGRIVEDLTISLPADGGDPAQDVRVALRLTPNVKCLVLLLPEESPVTLLNGLRFSRLEIFSTNLSHRTLVSFILTHGTLTALVLRECGSTAICPLRGLEMRFVTALQCPSRCFAGLVRDRLSTATVNLTRLNSMSALAIQTISSSRLHTLTVDHFSNDYDILARVVVAAPNLRKLKLNEKPHLQRRSGHLRRPWNDGRAWHSALLRLVHLEELMLRTLVSINSGNRTERGVVTSWANGVGRHRVAHPNLFHIGIIQKVTAVGAPQQRISHWFKGNAGGWTLMSATAIGPTDSFVL